jgi:predicted permease
VEAERRFGDIDEARRRLHTSARRREDRMHAREWLDATRRDLTLAVRALRRTPYVTTVAVLSLALGIGANAATFSLFDELLRRPLPVREPERLVNLGAPGPKPGNDQCTYAGSCEEVFSYPMFRDLERAETPFTGIAAHKLTLMNVAHGTRTMSGSGMLVSGSYFPLLGLRPALGRLFSPADDVAPGGHPVAVLSHRFWTSELGADPGVIGSQITVNDQRLTIIGVAPRGFEGTTQGVRPMLYAPATMAAALKDNDRETAESRRAYMWYLFARLDPGVTIDEARTRVNVLYRSILADVEAPLQKGMSEATLARFKAREITVTPGARGQSALHATTRTPIIFLFAITGLVVLIACANIANLLLARAAARATEMAVRLSLGAGRRRLLAQLLTESLLLAALGGAASLLVANVTLDVIASILPSASLIGNTALDLSLRPSVFLFAAALSILTGLLFGIVPALYSTRSDLMAVIRGSAGQPSGGRGAARFRGALVTGQIALSTALLIAAGLFVMSLRNVAREELGLQADRIVMFGVLTALNGYDQPREYGLYERMERELAALPGVTGVTMSGVPLLAGSTSGHNVRVEGFERGPDTDANSRMNKGGPGFFRTMGIPLRAGRDFTDADRDGAPKVAIVNEAFARKFGLGRDAVGKRMAMDGDGTGTELDIEIVGLAADAKYDDVKADAPPLFVIPYRQHPTWGAAAWYVRTAGEPEPLLRTVAATMARLAPGLPVVELKTLPQQIRETVYIDRMIGTLSAAFAALATLLAAVGLYGVLAYTVAQRTREIGVRMALGADARRVRGMVLRQVGLMTLVGGVAGIAAALGLGRAAQSLLYQLEGHDPAVVMIATAVLALVALSAGYIPALRASRVDPMQALRYE